MTADETTEFNPFPDSVPVLVKYPQTEAEEKAGRKSWPWLPGTIVQRCGPDEWQVCVEAREVAVTAGGHLFIRLMVAPVILPHSHESGTQCLGTVCRIPNVAERYR